MGQNRGRSQVKGAVKVGDFSKAFGKEMVKYTRLVEEKIQYVTKQLTIEAAKDLNVASEQFIDTGSSQYNKGWAAKNMSVRHRARWVIHNKNAPGLAHLLEHGHAKTSGGRVTGNVHIAPIEEKLVKDYEENVAIIIERGY